MPDKFLEILSVHANGMKMKKYEIYHEIVVTLRLKFDLMKALTPL